MHEDMHPHTFVYTGTQKGQAAVSYYLLTWLSGLQACEAFRLSEKQGSQGMNEDHVAPK